ncbi:MAG: hypothetical protein LBS90_03335 [Oscillospiraceae bacterium]|jgi:hypothetical protein|nr:hypothetical protein [Oscillospiraceae bacterium]
MIPCTDNCIYQGNGTCCLRYNASRGSTDFALGGNINPVLGAGDCAYLIARADARNAATASMSAAEMDFANQVRTAAKSDAKPESIQQNKAT